MLQKYLKFLFFALGVLAFLVIQAIFSLPDGMLHAFVLNIGQGDSILIRTPNAQHILIDGGPDNKVLHELSKVMPFYIHRIDAVIVSHPHADHLNGLIDVLKRYEVGTVIMTGIQYRTPQYKEFLNEIKNREIPISFVRENQDYRLDNLTLDILYPFDSVQGDTIENQNNASIVFRLLYGEKSFYFSGDLEMEKEAELVHSQLNLHANFYKVGHHGSRTSSTPQLLDRMKPEFAVISCGIENQFKHPHEITLQHLSERKIQLYRTDLDGTVEAISNGKYLSVRPFINLL